jgi:hypothetical protein
VIDKTLQTILFGFFVVTLATIGCANLERGDDSGDDGPIPPTYEFPDGGSYYPVPDATPDAPPPPPDACTPPPPECTCDDDCDHDERCHAGKCYEKCSCDNDCHAGSCHYGLCK